MENNLKRLFNQLDTIEAPPGLEASILLKIQAESRKRARINLFVFGLLDLVSFTGLIAAAVFLANLLVRSGFTQYLSLIISEDGAIINYWQELILSLAESLPVLSLAVLLTVAIVLIWSTAKTIINVNLIYQKYV